MVTDSGSRIAVSLPWRLEDGVRGALAARWHSRSGGERCPPCARRVFAAILLLLTPLSPRAESEGFTLDVSAAGVYQHGSFDDALKPNGEQIGDTGRGSLALDVESSFRVGHGNVLFAAASVAEGDGLDGVGGVSVRVNADDLEDDLNDINGRGRDYLREAWYAFESGQSGGGNFGITAGIIDATRYIDLNRVANDETQQFMNEVFVNRFFLPSYDPGIALSARGGNWSVQGVWMNTRTQAVDGGYEGFDFFGLDIGNRYEIAAGAGNFRLILLTTSDSFGEDDSAVQGAGFSMDQEIGEHVMIFSRAGIFREEPSVLVHKSLYSGGLQISGSLFHGPEVTMGVAYAFLGGIADSPGDVRDTRVWEAYARWNPYEKLGISLDVQHIDDELRQAGDPSLWAIGLRAYYAP